MTNFCETHVFFTKKAYNAAREIRQLNNPVPIIALSANVFESDVRKSMESGMNAHLPKPLDVEQLLETIRSEIYAILALPVLLF